MDYPTFFLQRSQAYPGVVLLLLAAMVCYGASLRVNLRVNPYSESTSSMAIIIAQ